MWFMNKIVNPFIKLILRSPLHGWMSAAVLLITYRGRKSGKEYTLPVQYVQDGNNVYIVPGYAEKKTWWRNLKGGADMQITLKGQTKPGRGILLERDADAEEIAKTLRLYIQCFPPAAKMHNVRIEADGQPNANDLGKAAKDILMVRVALK
jgi:deazaflavin-dependent oxidoreductase (nitroreductase family)